MSCFIVGEKTMQRCVSALHDHQQPCEAADQLGRELWLLNFAAWDSRYPNDKTTATDREIVAEWKWKLTCPVTDGHGNPWRNNKLACQWLKSLVCLRYQCSEGNCDESPLYGRLTKRINDMALAIIAEMPEYKSAEWE
jgi:hypothetical protein